MTVSTTQNPAGLLSSMLESRLTPTPSSDRIAVVRVLDAKNARGTENNPLMREIVDGSIFDRMLAFKDSRTPEDNGASNFGGRSLPYFPNKPRRKSRGIKAKVKVFDAESEVGILGRDKSVIWFKGGYVELLHRLTSGSGSFSHRILIPHWGYLKNVSTGS